MAIESSPDTEYDLFLKIHTKTDAIWRERMLESLCGTPEQVQSIFNSLLNQSRRHSPTLIAPHGTVFGPSTQVNDIFPHIPRKLRWDLNASRAFDDVTVKRMNEVKQLLDGTEQDFTENQLSIVAGTCFWVNHEGLLPRMWANQYEKLYEGMTSGYSPNLKMEHALERVIPSLIMAREGGLLYDIQPAPRPLALYFPQYHKVPENDRFWGENFTEWTLLKNLEVPRGQPQLKKPLPREYGGLGYYNLEQTEIRKQQADLARRHGIHGFCFYHYWFSGKNAPPNHLVMHKIPEAMLADGEPNLPFMFSWANEPWTKRWSGRDTEILISQTYGDMDDWIEHYHYLLPFFRHERYIRVKGSPVFAIYRPGHIGGSLRPMIECWQRLARVRGDFPNGLHFVQTLGNFYEADRKNLPELVTEEMDSMLDASFQFFPQILRSFPFGQEARKIRAAASYTDVTLHNMEPNRHVQYWGAFVGFDRRPRVMSAPINRRTPLEFKNGLCLKTFPILASYRNRNIGTNFLFITAWNEWNEQAVLEPNSDDHFGYLNALKYCLSNVPALQVKI